MIKTDHQIPDLNQEEFEIFLLIYVGHVDYNFTEDEKTFVENRTDEETYNRLYSLFIQNGDFYSLKIIMKHKDKYYNTEESRQKLYMLLKDMFHIDGEFSRVEKVFVTFFKRMPKF